MNEKKLTIIEHLTELRGRVIACLIASLVGATVAYYLYTPVIFKLLRGPLDMLSGHTDNPFVPGGAVAGLFKAVTGPEGGGLNIDLHFMSPPEAFMVRLKSAFFGGLILGSPFIFHQLWAFVAAGLTEREKRGVRLYLPVSLGLFFLGVLVAYLVMLPMVLYFLLVISGEGLVPTIMFGNYVSLVMGGCLSFGLVFQMPIIIMFLTHIGVVTPEFLAGKRRYAIIIIFIVAAILTPPDVVSQFIMAIPMLVLYEVSIWMSRLALASRRKRLAG